MAASQPEESELIDAPEPADESASATASDAAPPAVTGLRARPEERFSPWRRNAFASRTWQLVTASIIMAIYAAGLIYLLRWDANQPQQQIAKQEETPVEIVVEKPPEPKPPEKKPDPPRQETKQEIEKPATSAPRAPNEEKVDTEKQDKATHAPKAPTPPAARQAGRREGGRLPERDAGGAGQERGCGAEGAGPVRQGGRGARQGRAVAAEEAGHEGGQVKPRRRCGARRRHDALPAVRSAGLCLRAPDEEVAGLRRLGGLTLPRHRLRDDHAKVPSPAFLPSDVRSVTLTFDVGAAATSRTSASRNRAVTRRSTPRPSSPSGAPLRFRRRLPVPPHGLIRHHRRRRSRAAEWS